MIYLDSNALVKLIRDENHTVELLAWLDQQDDHEYVASSLVEIEVPRALLRSQPAALSAVKERLSQVSRLEMDAPVRATAAGYKDPYLRSFDAIHLATAENLVASGKSVTAFVTYDKRLGAAAVQVGLTVVAPGAE